VKPVTNEPAGVRSALENVAFGLDLSFHGNIGLPNWSAELDIGAGIFALWCHALRKGEALAEMR
jgi:hypothetical protein